MMHTRAQPIRVLTLVGIENTTSPMVSLKMVRLKGFLGRWNSLMEANVIGQVTRKIKIQVAHSELTRTIPCC
jgi:hypothetical protein